MSRCSYGSLLLVGSAALLLALAPTATAAERVVLGEEFSATW